MQDRGVGLFSSLLESELAIQPEIDRGAMHMSQSLVDMPVCRVAPAARGAVIFFAGEIPAGTT